MRKKYILVLFIFVLPNSFNQQIPLFAQQGVGFSGDMIALRDQASDTTLEYLKWRVTLLHSVGFNGGNTRGTTAKYSINLIGGIHGGLDGREIGLLYNIEEYYVRGFQLSGGANISGGEMLGMNVAGLTNISQSTMAGLQISGLANLSNNSMSGLQLSGLVNASMKEMTGFHMAGVANISNEDLSGMQMSFGLNISNSDLEGLNLAGLLNLANDDIEGLSMAGLSNISTQDQSGLIFSSFGNISGSSLEGLVLTGGLNLSKDVQSGLIFSGLGNISQEIEGLSISGAMSLSRELNGLAISPLNIQETISGLHIGVFNFAREINGASLGLISWYGNGRKNIDLRYSDGGFIDLGFTTGTHRLYNQLSVGYNPILVNHVKLGAAAGFVMDARDRFKRISTDDLSITHELAYYEYIGEDFDERNEKQLSYRFLLSKLLNEQVSLYFGPSINLMYSLDQESDELLWYSPISITIKDKELNAWLGFNLGIRLFKQKMLPPLEDKPFITLD